MVLQAIKYSRGHLEILDQLRLPHEEIYIEIKHSKDAWHAIHSMQVRGAPAIAIVAALSVAIEAANVVSILDQDIDSKKDGSTIPAAADTALQLAIQLEYLVTSRPTAVNLADAAAKLKTIVNDAAKEPNSNCRSVVEAYISAAEKMLVDDVSDNERIATAGYGTALGVIRSLHSKGSLRHVFYTETRPYNQGSRLTGYELIHDGLPATLITDSMAAALMNTKGKMENITAVVVGADRVTANGDTANKIGTFALAVLARYHGVKFLVAAPSTTVDMKTKSGADIVIEERPQVEMLNIRSPRVVRNALGEPEIERGSIEEVCVAAQNTHAWNPAFDVTPAELIDGIVTEEGVVEKDEHGVFRWDKIIDAEDFKDTPKVGELTKMNILPDGTTAVES
ncbi:MAG: hypothetical protein Q9219_000064 [cf. Caloplaca sp. 3 TL-2023]